MPTVSFKTLGCRLNQAETATMAASFESHGYQIIDFKAAADVCIIHTCTITVNAEKECARLARRLRRRTPAPLIVLAGCAVEAFDDQQRESTAADLLIDQARKPEIARIVDETLGRCPPTDACQRNAPTPTFSTTRALVKIQDGCSFFCSYCIVPFTRGLPNSLDFDEIVQQSRTLASQGYREIGLTGANIGCYTNNGKSLLDLLTAVGTLPGVERLRISSIEPTTIEKQVIDLMADSDIPLAPYLHLPLQSGDNHILTLMRRRYTRESFRDVVLYAKTRLPLFGLGTDIVTGFPGETQQAFKNTRDLVEELPFTNLHVFPYSERPGTRAATMPDSVPVELRRERANELIAIGDRKQREFANSQRSTSVQVLIERVNDHGMGRGWTAEYVETHVAGLTPDSIGQIITVTPDQAPDGKLAVSPSSPH